MAGPLWKGKNRKSKYTEDCNHGEETHTHTTMASVTPPVPSMGQH